MERMGLLLALLVAVVMGDEGMDSFGLTGGRYPYIRSQGSKKFYVDPLAKESYVCSNEAGTEDVVFTGHNSVRDVTPQVTLTRKKCSQSDFGVLNHEALFKLSEYPLMGISSALNFVGADSFTGRSVQFMDRVTMENGQNGLFYAHDVNSCGSHPLSAESRGYFATVDFSKKCMAFPSPLYENAKKLQQMKGTVSFSTMSRWNSKNQGNMGRLPPMDVQCELEKSDSNLIILGNHSLKGLTIWFDRSMSRLGFSRKNRMPSVCPAQYKCSSEQFNVELQRCEDVCSYYLFQTYDAGSGKCVISSSATLALGVAVGVLVLGEIALLALDKIVWGKLDNPPAAGNDGQ